MTILNIVEAAAKIKAQTGEQDPFRIAKSLGIYVLYRSIGKCKGFFVIVDGIRIIVINDNIHEIMQRAVCAHELGHAELHPNDTSRNVQFIDINTFSLEKSEKEFETNIFASEILIEDCDVIETMTAEMNFYQMAMRLNVPPEMLAFKIKAMQKKGYDIPNPPEEPDSMFLRD